MNEMVHRLISINKPHTDNIFSGKKGVEWRKGDLGVGVYYVYETKNKGGCGMVIGEIKITLAARGKDPEKIPTELVELGCVPREDLIKYSGGKPLTALFIGNYFRYNKPKKLGEFRSPTKKDWTYGARITRPPQSWCYVEELQL